jgi:hypothetical protein
MRRFPRADQAERCKGRAVILRSNLPRLCELAARAPRVLDVGGWHDPFNLATHVIDINPYLTRGAPLDPQNAARFSAATWQETDICCAPWAYSDKFFDFAFCSHTLEDVRDPLVVLQELSRVARAGYVETPSRVREIFCKERFAGMKRLRGRPLEVGFYHHRWFVEADGAGLRFLAKTAFATSSADFYITRAELGRKLAEAESGIGLFWEGSVAGQETFVLNQAELARALIVFKRQALKKLTGSSIY